MIGDTPLMEVEYAKLRASSGIDTVALATTKTKKNLYKYADADNHGLQTLQLDPKRVHLLLNGAVQSVGLAVARGRQRSWDRGGYRGRSASRIWTPQHSAV